MTDKANIFFRVTPNDLDKYVLSNNLTQINDGMHRSYVDKDGIVKARITHGFAFDEYEIADEPNTETILLITNLFNR